MQLVNLETKSKREEKGNPSLKKQSESQLSTNLHFFFFKVKHIFFMNPKVNQIVSYFPASVEY